MVKSLAVHLYIINKSNLDSWPFSNAYGLVFLKKFVNYCLLMLIFFTTYPNMQEKTLSPLGSMNREEIFCFQKKFLKIFSKTPPKNPFPFQTSERTFNFLFKNTPIFSLPGSNKWRGIKKFFEIGRFWVCISAPFVQMSERSFFYGKIIKEIKTGMGLFYQSQNRQKNIQRPVPQMSEWL